MAVVAVDTVALIPLNFTVSLATVELKFVPLIVTVVPTVPLVGLKLEIVGAGVVTVKALPLVAVWPLTVTVTLPDVAPLGTATTN